MSTRGKAGPRAVDRSESFGFEPEESRHHFLVLLPKNSHDPVEVSEHFTWDDERGSSPGDAQLERGRRPTASAVSTP